MSEKEQTHEKIWSGIDESDELADNIAEELCSAIEDKLIMEDCYQTYYLMGFANGFRTAKLVIGEIRNVGKTETYHNFK